MSSLMICPLARARWRLMRAWDAGFRTLAAGGAENGRQFLEFVLEGSRLKASALGNTLATMTTAEKEGLKGWEYLPASVYRNISDKLYEKRKNAALEVEGAVKNYAAAGEHDKIAAIIDSLKFYVEPDRPLSAITNNRKGGLIGLAAVTVGLAGDANQHLDRIVPPVLKAFADPDGRVRYYACEALYNIAKVTRGDFIVFFNDIFDALCKLSADSDPGVQSAAHLLDRLIKDIVTESDQFSIGEFIPLLRERMNVLNAHVRQFLVGWITVLDSVPDIDMLGFLPDFLDGLFNMLSDQSHEIRQQADAALREFLQEIKNALIDHGRMAEILVQRALAVDEFTRLTALEWVNEFVNLGGQQLVPYYSSILEVVLPCISHKDESIRVVAKETSEKLKNVKAKPENGLDIEAVLQVAQRELESDSEATRLEALRWISVLLERYRTEVMSSIDKIFEALLKSLCETSDEVVLLVWEIQAGIAGDGQRFRRLMVCLVDRFKTDHALYEKRSIMVIRRLCTLLSSEKVYRELAIVLEGEADLELATMVVEELNLILVTAPELKELRALPEVLA
ncbi:hypothetical protein R1sor_010693 [Riccia sorocarpa]|uniref:Vacuolar protein 14 C-terminal Fig4-binding domain-containing protein n=1 Tax=Riccia sorocarpa TaxID=122646 RepID=A0ABD3HYS6_9MARC